MPAAASSSGVAEVPAPDRPDRGRRQDNPHHLRQLRHPQTSSRPTVAAQPQAVPFALHAHLGLVAEHVRALRDPTANRIRRGVFQDLEQSHPAREASNRLFDRSGRHSQRHSRFHSSPQRVANEPRQSSGSRQRAVSHHASVGSHYQLFACGIRLALLENVPHSGCEGKHGQVLIVAFVAAKGSIFPDADVDVP